MSELSGTVKEKEVLSPMSTTNRETTTHLVGTDLVFSADGEEVKESSGPGSVKRVNILFPRVES